MRTGIVHLSFTSLCVAALLWRPQAAAADPAPERPPWFAGLAAVGSAVRVEEAWDTGFGGEVGIGRLGAVGLAAASVGGIVYSEPDLRGRVWSELSLGSRWPTGWVVGLGGGPVVELDELRAPRIGGQATLWVLAGVVPYVRVGGVEESGVFADIGVRIAFPAVSW